MRIIKYMNMNPNYPPQQYNTKDLEELNQKIQHRFIREVVKPYSNSIKKKPHFQKGNYEIPKSSELLIETTKFNVGVEETRSTQNFTPVVIHSNPQTCIDIHRHVHQCPICLKLYRPYNPILMIVIVILCLIILFLIKYCFMR